MGPVPNTVDKVEERYTAERHELDMKQGNLLFAMIFVSAILIVVVAALLVSDLQSRVSEIYSLIGLVIGIANVGLIALIILEVHYLNETLRKAFHWFVLKEESQRAPEPPAAPQPMPPPMPPQGGM